MMTRRRMSQRGRHGSIRRGNRSSVVRRSDQRMLGGGSLGLGRWRAASDEAHIAHGARGHGRRCPRRDAARIGLTGVPAGTPGSIPHSRCSMERSAAGSLGLGRGCLDWCARTALAKTSDACAALPARSVDRPARTDRDPCSRPAETTASRATCRPAFHRDSPSPRARS